jgi:type II secretory pathway component PulJ
MSDFTPTPAARSRQSGLTVLELVSALALFVIVLGTLMVALNSATDIWSRTTGKSRTQAQARRALEQLVKDLAGAVAVPTDPRRSLPPASGLAETSSDEPFFLAESQPEQQTGIYFVRQCSPNEVAGEGARALELVAYCWTTNGLSRYAVPVVSSENDRIEPRVSDQLASFAQEISSLQAASNVIAASIVQFVPLVYKPASPSVPTSETQPVEPLNRNGENLELGDLPDYVDVLLACAERQSGAASGGTNYLTRRIILPAAQAARLP